MIALLLGLMPAAGHAQTSQSNCQYILGFKALHDLDSAHIGDCVDNQAFAANGDAQQHTTKGLMAWRKADNWTAFTNGYTTWINGPAGLVSRLNTERFSFEHDLATFAGVWACSKVLVRIKPDGSGEAMRFKQPWLPLIQGGAQPADLVTSQAVSIIWFQLDATPYTTPQAPTYFNVTGHTIGAEGAKWFSWSATPGSLLATVSLVAEGRDLVGPTGQGLQLIEAGVSRDYVQLALFDPTLSADEFAASDNYRTCGRTPARAY